MPRELKMTPQAIRRREQYAKNRAAFNARVAERVSNILAARNEPEPEHCDCCRSTEIVMYGGDRKPYCADHVY